MKTVIAFIIISVVISQGTLYAKSNVILARVHEPPWVFSLETSGSNNISDNECTLDLVAEQNRRSFRTSLKSSVDDAGDLACSLFGPISINASSSSDDSKSLVIVEAGHGGDGDHSGPIVQIFELGNGRRCAVLDR